MSESETVVWKGKTGEVFAGKDWLVGSVTRTSESWTITLHGDAKSVSAYAKGQSGIYLNSEWQPSGVNIPSRNTVRVCGWEPSFSGQTGTLKIYYSFDESKSYLSAGQEPSETREESIRATLVAVPISECPAIWTTAQMNENYREIRALYVEYCKAFMNIRKSSSDYDTLRKEWEKNFKKDADRVGGVAVGTKPWEDDAFKNIKWCLSNGIDQYHVDTYQITVRQNLNEEPNLSGLNTFNEPELEILSLPKEKSCRYWYQCEDSVAVSTNGQFCRTRSWLGVSSKTPLYEG